MPQALEGVASVGAALRGGAALVRPGRRSAGRAALARDAGRGADVPVQQPRRAAGAAADRRRPTPRCGRSSRAGPAGWCWPARWSASASSPRCCRRSWCCPASALVYLVAGPRRCWSGSLAAGVGLVAVVVAAGWWVAAVMLTPAADRPYVGGSTNNSILQLALGYNGFGRLTGNETGSVGFTGGRGGGPAFGGVDRPEPAVRQPRWAGRSAGCCRPR